MNGSLRAVLGNRETRLETEALIYVTKKLTVSCDATHEQFVFMTTGRIVGLRRVAVPLDWGRMREPGF